MENRRLDIEYHYDRFISGINDRCRESLDYIDKTYSEKDEFYRVNTFSKNLVSLVTGKSNLGVLIRLIASVDSFMELDNSLNLAFSFQYKSAFDSLRRALEITILGVYYDLVENDYEKITNWINSQVNAPYFSGMIQRIIIVDKFKDLNEKFKWDNEIKHLYWKLSDYSHTKGFAKSITELNKVNYSETTKINSTSLNEFLNNYIETIQNIAVVCSVNHPILLVGLPTTEKFGFNSPLGLFNDSQSENLKNIIPSRYKAYFDNLVKMDVSIKIKEDSIAKMPVSENYIKIQDSLKKNKNAL